MAKRILSSILVGFIILINTQVVYASTDGNSDYYVNEVPINNNNAYLTMTSGLSDLEVQLNDLYAEVGRRLGIDYIYVKMLHLAAGGKAVYADRRPNIYTDITVEDGKGPMDIEGTNTKYEKSAPWAICPDPKVDRPSKYYMPDAVFNVTQDIVKIMNERITYDRGDMQYHFNKLNIDVKTTIIFAESLMLYSGSSVEMIDRIFPIYSQILYDKEKYENVLYMKGDGIFHFKEEFLAIITENGIESDAEIRLLAIVLSFDNNLAASESEEVLNTEIDTPYKIGYTSRENMMIAAASITGKVRYVWGGGHLSAGSIQGINPMWKAFYDSYENHGKYTGGSIIPNGSMCPVHGEYDDPNGCLFVSNTVYSVDDYLIESSRLIDTSEMNVEQFRKIMMGANYLSQGLPAHRLDGLDCSGFANWVFSQVNSTYAFSSGATAFISQTGMVQLDYGSEMLPGDVFSWGEHIVIIVGAIRPGSKSYVIIESSPITVQYGIIYYSGASESDIKEATNLAREANILIGGLNDDWQTNRYNIDAMGYYYADIAPEEQYNFGEWAEQGEWVLNEDQTEWEWVVTPKSEEPAENSNVTREKLRYAAMGRMKSTFIDESTVIPNYNKTMKNMTAQEIIQNTVDKLGADYLTGYDKYDGALLHKPDVLRNPVDGAEKADENEEIPVVISNDTKNLERLNVEELKENG